jgi:hypothetical protein
MCTLIHRGILRDVDNLPVKLADLANKTNVLDTIQCAKFDEYAPGICAISPESFFEKDAWTIFLGGSSIGIFDGNSVVPKWRKKDDIK